MPLTHRVSTRPPLLLVSARGVLTDQELVEGYRAAYADEAHRPGMDELVDFRNVARFDLTAQGIRRLIDLTVGLELGDVPFRSAVVTRSAAMTGMVRMYEILREESPEDTRVFESMDDALEFLGLEEEP